MCSSLTRLIRSGKVAPEFFGQQNNTYLFIGEDFIESLFYFLHFMDNNALDACQAHSGERVNVVAYQVHLHYNLPRIMKEMISP